MTMKNKKETSDEEFVEMLQQAWDRHKRLLEERSPLPEEWLIEATHKVAHKTVQADARRRSMVRKMVLVVVLAALPVAVLASIGVYRAQPAPDGYTINIGSNRAEMVASIDNILSKTL